MFKNFLPDPNQVGPGSFGRFQIRLREPTPRINCMGSTGNAIKQKQRYIFEKTKKTLKFIYPITSFYSPTKYQYRFVQIVFLTVQMCCGAKWHFYPDPRPVLRSPQPGCKGWSQPSEFKLLCPKSNNVTNFEPRVGRITKTSWKCTFVKLLPWHEDTSDPWSRGPLHCRRDERWWPPWWVPCSGYTYPGTHLAAFTAYRLHFAC